MYVTDCSLAHVTQTHYFKYQISFVTSCRRIIQQNVADSADGHQSQQVHTEPPLLHESTAARPVLYTIGVVGFVPFS
jgi:hypothetical protein